METQMLHYYPELDLVHIGIFFGGKRMEIMIFPLKPLWSVKWTTEILQMRKL